LVNLIQVTASSSGGTKIANSFRENCMKHNVGTIDRVLRIALGLALIGSSLLGYIGLWGWIGLLPLATGVFRFCPAYWPFGVSTCPAPSAGARP